MATRVRGTSAVMCPLIARYLRCTQRVEAFCPTTTRIVVGEEEEDI